MEEKVLTKKKNGMAVLILIIAMYGLAVMMFVMDAMGNPDADVQSAGFAGNFTYHRCYDPDRRPEGAEAAGGAGVDAFRQIHRNTEERRILLCQSVLHHL